MQITERIYWDDHISGELGGSDREIVETQLITGPSLHSC